MKYEIQNPLFSLENIHWIQMTFDWGERREEGKKKRLKKDLIIDLKKKNLFPIAIQQILHLLK